MNPIRRIAFVCVLLVSGSAAADDPLRVVATVPDLGSLAESVGGDAVEVTVLVRGPQDPHFVEPRPSFVRNLHEADLFAVVGMDLEIGWTPKLLQSARNPRVQPGEPGYLDASVAIQPLEVPTRPFDRSQGDLHPYGNPHYLTDPLNGLRVAALLRDRLATLRPGRAAVLEANYQVFADALLRALVGDELVASHPPEALVRALESGTLDALAGDTPVGGWLGRVRPQPAIEDHKAWAYFARRFGLELVATLEPLPGIAPTTRHLAEVVERAEASGAELVLSAPYMNPRPARRVAERIGGRVAELAHQVGARPDTGDYLTMCDYNVRQIARAP